MKTIRFQPHHRLRLAQLALAIAFAFSPILYAISSDIGEPRSQPLAWSLFYFLTTIGYALIIGSFHGSKRRPTAQDVAGEHEAVRYALEVAERLNVGLTCIKFSDEKTAKWRASTVQLPLHLLSDSDPSERKAATALAFTVGRISWADSSIFFASLPLFHLTLLMAPSDLKGPFVFGLLGVVTAMVIGLFLAYIRRSVGAIEEAIAITGDELSVRRYLETSQPDALKLFITRRTP